MNGNWKDISTKIDEATVTLFRDFTYAVGEIPWLLIGATARDIFAHHIHGLSVERATRDIDFGIEVGSWSHYEMLKERLLSQGRFTAGSIEHRLTHQNNIPIDLIPFGSVATQDNRITWPQSTSNMNVSGYGDALRGAIFIKISSDPSLEIPIASPASIAILKIIAWSDRARAKDAYDLAYLIEQYLSLGNWERLEGKDADITEREEFSIGCAGAELLGRDIASITTSSTRALVSEILDREINQGESSPMVKTMLMRKQDDHLMLLKSMIHGIAVSRA